MNVHGAPDVAGLPIGWGAIFGLLNLLLGGGVIATWLKLRPKMREMDISERKTDIDDMRARIGELEKRVDKANNDAAVARDAANVVKMQMVSMQAAFELVSGELERADPNNTVLKQARRLIAQAATRDMGVGDAMTKIALMPGVGE